MVGWVAVSRSGPIAGLVAVVSACTLVGVGCQPTESAGERSTTPTIVLPSKAQLQAVLLTPADVQPGWVARSADPLETEFRNEVFDTTCEAGRDALKKETHDAAAVILESPGSAAVLEALVAAPNTEADLADVKNAFDICVATVGSNTTVTQSSVTGSMAVVPAPGDVGDQAFAYQTKVGGSVGQAPVAMEVTYVFVQHRVTIEVYQYVDLTPSDDSDRLPTPLVSIIKAGDAKTNQTRTEATGQ